MALPWSLPQSARLAHGNLVEDMQLSLDVAVAGRAPRFCPQARVSSELPRSRKASAAQRTRWEHGHLSTLCHQVPRLVTAAVG